MRNNENLDLESEFPPSGLFGLYETNIHPKALLKKSFFSNSFSSALACYMMVHEIPAIYALIDPEPGIRNEKISIEKVFNSPTRNPKDLYFVFGGRFPFTALHPFDYFEFNPDDSALEKLERIDLSIYTVAAENLLSTLDIYLTVLPDQVSNPYTQNLWGCELAITQPTIASLILRIFSTIGGKRDQVLKIFHETFGEEPDWKHLDWQRPNKIEPLTEASKHCIDQLGINFGFLQKPFLLEAIWRTEKQSPIITKDAFDLVIWSDFAVSQLLVERGETAKTLSPFSYHAVRMVRSLWELCKYPRSSNSLREILIDVVGTQEKGKCFSINGIAWRSFIKDKRIENPIITLKQLAKIINFRQLFNLVPDRQLQQSLIYMYNHNMLE